MMGFREERREDAQQRTPVHSVRDDVDYDHRHFVNLCAAAALLTLALGFGWTVKIFDQQQRMERCLMSGRKDCVEIGRVTRGPVQLPQIVSR